MKRNIFLSCAALLAASVFASCYKDDHQPPMVEGGHAGVDFVIDNNKVITDNFLGFGTQYNNNLYTTRTFENDGVSEENLPDLEKKVLALGSQYVRIFFDKKNWESVSGYNPEYKASFIRTVELAQKTGALVNITYWHSSIPEDMGRFADEIYDLIVNKGLTCVKQVTIQNEVNSTKITPDEYRVLYSVFIDRLKELGIRDKIQLVGGDLVQDNQKTWFEYMSTSMATLLDGYSSHIYWDYWDKVKPVDRLSGVADLLSNMQGQGIKPCYITEYGVRGEKSGGAFNNPGYLRGTDTPIGRTNECALRHVTFHINALNYGFAGLVKWDCYKAKYDNGNQYFPVMGSGTDGYPLYPSYWMTWAFTHSCQPGWKVLSATSVVSSAHKLCAAMSDGVSNYTIYAQTTATVQTPFVISGIPANKKFRVLAWNDDLMGGLTELEPVTSDAEGVVRFNVKPDGFITLTTIDFTLPEGLE